MARISDFDRPGAHLIEPCLSQLWPRTGERSTDSGLCRRCFSLVRRQAFQEVEGFDEGFFMYTEEVDWCYTMAKHGWQVWYQPDEKVTHLGGASSAVGCHLFVRLIYIAAENLFFRKTLWGPQRPAPEDTDLHIDCPQKCHLWDTPPVHEGSLWQIAKWSLCNIWLLNWKMSK